MDGLLDQRKNGRRGDGFVETTLHHYFTILVEIQVYLEVLVLVRFLYQQRDLSGSPRFFGQFRYFHGGQRRYFLAVGGNFITVQTINVLAFEPGIVFDKRYIREGVDALENGVQG